MLKKLLLLSLALVVSFGLVAFVGCKKLSQEEIDQIIDGAIAAQYDSFSFGMEMPMAIEVTGGSDAGGMTVAMEGSGVIDVVNKEMQMTMSMAMDITGYGEQEMEAETYIVDGWMYVGTEVSGLGYQWVKMEITEEIWQQQLSVEQQVELLETAVDIDYEGTDTVNGVECYVFDIEPDMGTLGTILGGGMSDLGLDFDEFALDDLYKELTVKEWVAKDGCLVMRTEIKIVAEMSAEEAGALTGDFDKMAVTIELNMDCYDYNQPVSITLPPEALAAEETSLEY